MAEKWVKRIIQHINLGTIILFIIIFYIAAYVVSYLGKDKLAVYEVGESNIVDSIEGTGAIIRNEHLYVTEEEGYVNYFVRDGARIQKGGMVYSVDTSGKIQSFLEELLEKKGTVGEEELERTAKGLRTFMESYSDDNFLSVYEIHKELSHDITAYTDNLLGENKEKLEKKYGKKSYISVPAQKEGIVSMSSDGMEAFSLEKLTSDVFKNKSRMKDLRSADKLKKGDPVYRLVRGQNWKLAIPVSEGEFSHLSKLSEEGRKNIRVLFHKDNFETTAEFSCLRKKEKPYVVLGFTNYIQRYVDQRYLYAELILSKTEGLKIPTSALVDKETFQIPVGMLSEGGNSNRANVVNIRKKNKKGEYIIDPVQVDIVRTENIEGEDYAYVTGDGLEVGEVITDTGQSETYKLRDRTSVPGVYIVNRGYTVYKPVDIVQRNKDYCIISRDNSEVALYDRIILNSSTVEEDQVIY